MSQELSTSPKGNILIINDIPANLQLLIEILCEQKYKVRIAKSGKLALKSARLTPPDLILLDILMPQMDGYAICEQLKRDKRTKDIPVIFTSALPEAFDKVRAFAVGGADSITPPFQREEVLARVENQLSIRRLHKQLAAKDTQLDREIHLRQQAEQALRESEEKFFKAFQASPDPIAIATLAEGRYIDVNDSFCQLFGYSRDQVIGHTISELQMWLDLEERTRLQEMLNEAGVVRNLEFQFRTKSGEVRTVLLSAEIVDIGFESCVLSVTKDISDRKRAEEALRESEQRWQLAIAANNDGIWDLNLKTNKTFRSVRWKEMLGYSDSEIGESLEEWSNRLHPDDCNWVMATTQNYQNQKIPNFAIEYRLRCKDGSYKWILSRAQALWDESGKLVRVVGSNSDITERKIAEEKLQKSEAFLAVAQRIAHVGSWELDIFTQKITWSEELFRIFGLDPTEPEPTYAELVEKIYPDDRALFQQRVSQAISLGTSFELDFRILRPDGSIRYLEGRGEPVVSESGQVKKLFGSVLDITARKQAEAEIIRSKDLLESVFNESTDAIFLVDRVTGRIADCNQPAVELFEATSKDELINIEGHTLQKEQFTPEELSSIFDELDRNGFWSRELEYVSKEGKLFWGNLAAKQIYVANQEMHLVRLTDITERKHREEALRLIVEGTASATGDTFMRSCVRYLAEILQVRYAVIAELTNEARNRVRTLAFWTGETWSENIEYDLVNTPCEIVLQGRTCHYPQDLQALFPLDPDLVSLAAQSYLGIPLIDSSETIVGHLAVLDTKPMAPDPGKESIVKIFAARAGAELERQKTELALQVANERLQHLLKVSPAVIFSCKPEDYKTTFISENVTSVWGYPTGEFTENSSFWTERIHPDDVDRVLRELPRLSEEGERSHEYRFLHKDGTYHWLYSQLRLIKDDAGDPIEIVGYSVDISDRKRAEEALRESAERERAVARVIQQMRQTLDIDTIFGATTAELRQFLNCDRVAIYRFNPDWSGEFVAESVADGWVSLVREQENNPNLKESLLEDEDCVVKTLGVTDEPVRDTYLQDTQGGAYSQGASYLCVKDIYRVGFDPCYVQLLERFQARAYITVPIFCGSKLWGLLASYQNSEPRQWEAAEINIVVQIGTQLGVAIQQAELLAQTQRQALQLMEAKEAAEVANRAKSEFLANMSHELRTPLNAILGFTQVMNRDVSLSTEQQQYLGIILRSGEHLLELINDILEMSKIEAGRLTFNEGSFDLHYLLDSLQEMFHFKAQSKGIELSFERTTDVPQYVQTDEGKLRQVLINLLSNALKFTEEGRVTVRITGGTGERNERSVATAEEFSYSLSFEVSDTGPGIAPEELDSLFEVFSQTAIGRKSQQGTGLGLPISRSFVQLMGGDIAVNSTLGQGTTFKFNVGVKLGRTRDLDTQQPNGRVIGLAPDQKEYRILVVEDKWESRQLLVKLLTLVGFQVREAENGEQAVDLWSSWQPHLIWMDMQMPVMDGYEATRQIKSHLKGQATVIIALTASAFEEQRATILSAGCDDFVRKPFRENVLFSKMAEYLGVHYVYEEQEPLRSRLSEAGGEALNSEALAVMPEEWRSQIHLAAEACNDEEVFALIEQIPDRHAQLKLALTDLVENFRLDLIFDLTEISMND